MDLVPSINQSAGLVAGQIYSSQDELGQIESGHEDCSSSSPSIEPIYAEIQPRINSDGKKGVEVISSLEENTSKVNKILEREEGDLCVNNSGKKKEIEYWQITAKEVVRFRPCTETFIQRE